MNDERKGCPLCKEENKKSSVFYNGKPPTFLSEEKSYHEEGGIRHCHQVDKKTIFYQCSNFHTWSETGIFKCPAKGCDHGGDCEVKKGEVPLKD